MVAVFLTFHPLDTAKDIYRNITLEKLALIRFILEQQKGFTAAHQNWERSSTVNEISNKHNCAADCFQQDLGDLINVLKSTSGNIRDIADATSNSIIQNAQSVGDLLMSWAQILYLPQLFTKMETTLSIVNQRSFDDRIRSMDKVTYLQLIDES
jgi:hypothetical protein